MSQCSLLTLLNNDMFILIFSYLDLKSLLLSIQPTCRLFKDLIQNPQLDDLLFSKHLQQFLSDHLNFTFNDGMISSLLNIDHKLDLKNDCKKLMKDFMLNLITEETFVNDDYAKYCEKGGVIEISIYQPCELLKKLLKFYHTTNKKGFVKENFIISLHKFMLMKHVCSISGVSTNNQSEVQVLFSKTEVSFDMDEKNFYAITDFKHSKRMHIGNAFIAFHNNFKKLTSNRKLPKHVALSFNNKNVVAFNEIIQKANPEEGWEDIFESCSSPPYQMKKATEEVKNLKELLFGNDSDYYSWDHYLTQGNNTWSNYFYYGMEWWGCYAMTSYNYEKEMFIVSSASTTD